MELDPKIAESIVTNLKDVIHHEINLFNTTGTIIASTDKQRIGTGHDGARLAVKTKKVVPIDDEHEFKGARHGINMPVLFNGSVIAVIGITGNRQEVEPFGNVIEKMTEILIREYQEQITRFDQRERFTDLTTILSLKEHDANLVAYLASMLEINLSLPRRALIAQPASGSWPKQGRTNLYPILQNRLRNSKNNFFSISDYRMSAYIVDYGEHLAGFANDVQHDMERTLGCKVFIGIGDLATGQTKYWHSYQEALRAISWMAFSKGEGICAFSSICKGMLITSLPTEEAQEFVNHVFGDLPDEQIESFFKIFYAYVRHNGSIKHCSEELFMHKNTLQGRLNKIAEKTGYNPRKLDDFTVLDSAFMLWEYLKTKCPDITVGRITRPSKNKNA